MADPVSATVMLGTMALQGASTMTKAYGESQGQGYRAAVAERGAQVARVQADQTDTAARETEPNARCSKVAGVPRLNEKPRQNTLPGFHVLLAGLGSPHQV